MSPDILIVGAGLNGLVCALVLARAKMSVHVVDDRPIIGGVHRTEFPFAKVPRLATFTGTHRLGFVPRDLGEKLGLDLPLAPRDPALFVPGTERFLLAGPGADGLVRAVETAYGSTAARALTTMHEELDALVHDLEPAWLAGPLTVDEVSERFVRPALRPIFIDLVRGSLSHYLARFGIGDDYVGALLAFDALAGSFASPSMPNTGFTLLVRHAARRAFGGDAVPVGGLAALARVLADAAIAEGATIATSQSVTQILIEGNCAAGVVFADGTKMGAGTIVSGADPVRLRALLEAPRSTPPGAPTGDLLPPESTRRIDALAPQGGSVRLQLALTALPRFTCLPEDRGQHRATTLVFPANGTRALEEAMREAGEGRFSSAPALECVFPTATDPALADDSGRHAMSILVPWAPYDLAGTTWAEEEPRVTQTILDVLEAHAPGTSGLVVDAVLHHPKKLEAHFGVTRGQLGHIDETHAFGDRMPYATAVTGLYTCGRASAPAGGILGVPGWSAARRVLEDLELGLEETAVGYKS